ncbi:hypothetical protein QIG84_28495, partial [Klebsiella pneumoniae]|nr:hypothetical protein [Klebsiella pneumoniae]
IHPYFSCLEARILGPYYFSQQHSAENALFKKMFLSASIIYVIFYTCYCDKNICLLLMIQNPHVKIF